jgi:hypothetical protein
VPAGVGDIPTGIAAPLLALRLAHGTGRRRALWFNMFGITDLIVALTLGALTEFHLISATRVADRRGLVGLPRQGFRGVLTLSCVPALRSAPSPYSVAIQWRT